GGEEHRDDEDGDDVVEDREGEEEDAQPGREAAAEDGEDAECERDVGGGGDRPPVLEPGARRHREVDEDGDDDAAEGGDRRAQRRGGAVELARGELVAQLDGDDEEEDREQAVADPVADGEADRGTRQGDIGALEVTERHAERGVRGEEAEGGCDEEEQRPGTWGTQRRGKGGRRHGSPLLAPWGGGSVGHVSGP